MKSAMFLMFLFTLGSAQAALRTLPAPATVTPVQKDFTVEDTVKVYSGLCGQDESKFRGSGVILSNQGKFYVVTSNHVVLNGNGSFCHRVENKTIGKVSAELVASDWSAGLALLELKSGSVEVATLPLRTTDAQNNENMIASGFPYEGMELIQSTRGYVLEANSTRHWLGNSNPMIELMDTHAEYGMSGGPVFSADKSQVVGILSHQALEMTPGSPTEVRDFSDTKSSGTVFNHIFVIPSNFVAAWMMGILNGNVKPTLVEVASEQILGNHLVVSGDLAFSMTTAAQAGIGGGNGSGIGGGNGSGIGGGNGSGIGGGNGSGIGGDGESTSASPNDSIIEVTLAPLGYSTPSPFANADWYQATKKALLMNKKVLISVVIKKDAESMAPVRQKIQSLDQFFRELSDANTLPLPYAFATGVSADAAIGNAATPDFLKTDLKDMATALNFLTQDVSKLEEKQLVSRIKVTFDILSSVEWQNASAQDIAELGNASGNYAQAWTELFDSVDHDKFDASVKLMHALEDITEGLKHPQ